MTHTLDSISITRDEARQALEAMQGFERDLDALFGRHDIDLSLDLGRRNALVSGVMEKAFARQIGQRYPGTHADGKTGEPDIIVPGFRSVECKLTTRTKGGSVNLQSDSNHWDDDEGKDFLYVVASEDFSEFAVLFFRGLTRDDFGPEAPGSRGRVKMVKAKGFKKCEVLVGSWLDLSRRSLQKKIDHHASLVQKYGDSTSPTRQGWIQKAGQRITEAQSQAPRITIELVPVQA